MKTMKTLFLVAFMLTIVTGYANENVIDVPSKAITVLKFSNVKKGHQYTIIDNQGVLLYSETIDRNGTFSKKFDFTALKDGSYTVELNKDFEIIVTPFIVQSKSVIFLESKVRTVFKPVVRTKGNQLLISLMSMDVQTLDIELFYNGESIFKDQLKGDQILNQVYKLSSQEKGDYYLHMTSGDRVFNKSFKLL
ncbi:hypothetical protein [Psychroserpens luteus]|uniref:Por secretion system C-terminal sorting domain-containing protein n=1 Tax=Psychroserpens luteus TaxID=1434066 RepID=A0ABW5ZV16_9FLAO|nr:hypothetical protein [Psychroserpens luteus]